MNKVRLIPLDDTVVFPGMEVTLTVDVGTDTRVLLVPRRNNAYAHVGVVADVTDRVRRGRRGVAISMTPLHRGIPGAAAADPDGVLRVDVEAQPDRVPPEAETRELEREYRAVVDEIPGRHAYLATTPSSVRSITDPGALADTSGYSP